MYRCNIDTNWHKWIIGLDMYLIHSPSITLRRRSDPFFNIFSSDEEYGGINRPLSFSSPRNLPSSSLRFSTISKNYIFYFEEIFPQFFPHSVEESEPAVFIFRRSADSDFAGKRYDFERNFSTRNKISIDRDYARGANTRASLLFF